MNVFVSRRCASAAVVLALALALAGCETTGSQRETVGTVLGGIGGAVLGAQVGRGTGRVVATAIGAVGGALIGREIARYLDQADQQNVAASTEATLASGQAHTWRNPDTGVSGRSEVAERSTRSGAVVVPVQKDRVQEIPPLDLIGESYTATGNVNVRGGPGTDYRVVGSLARGEAVQVVGSVQGRDWYLISQGGAASGFVATTLLTPAPATMVAAAPAPPVGAESATVQASQECNTVRQEVTLADGSTRTDLVTACRGPNGWEIQDA